jgi:hypothetical protein
VIPAGTVVHGHLAQMENVYSPRRQVSIAIRFDAIVLNGTPVPLTFEPRGPTMRMDQNGRAVFRFLKARLVLGKDFESQWRVHPPAP